MRSDTSPRLDTPGSLAPDQTNLPGKTNNKNGWFAKGITPPKRYREQGRCEGPGCNNIVPGGMVSLNQKRFFCCVFCRNSFRNNRHDIGRCVSCGGVLWGNQFEKGIQKYCTRDCRITHKAECLIAPTGPFRPLIEEYLALGIGYEKSTLTGVRTSLIRFFTFIFQKEGLVELEGIRPSAVTRFLADERQRGMKSHNCVPHLSTFFSWLLVEERVDMASPVIPRRHSSRNGGSGEPRPYSDAELGNLWSHLVKRGNRMLMLAFKIGLECGLRVGEVANIRLSDIDRDKQQIFIRLPTKNKSTRTVRFHDGVALQLEAWLKVRTKDCKHDHLLHGAQSKPLCSSSMCDILRKCFSSMSWTGSPISFHRLRHTWATRLINNGMEVAVLQELGGWRSLGSMQRYTKILPSTVDRQYEQSYRKMQELQDASEEQMMSLLDFVTKSSETVPDLGEVEK